MTIKTIKIQRDWFEGKCPGCKKTIYIDNESKRTFHQVPLCTWYINYCSKAKSEGKVELLN